MKPALVVLAAGASSRLGRCKALVRLGGATVLERLLAAGACLDAQPPLVVTGADHEAIERAAPAGCRVVHNPRWGEGRSTGLLLAHLMLPERSLCVAPVDVPLVPPELFAALARKWEGLGAPSWGWLAPRLERPGHPGHGRHGHPVVLGPGLLSRLQSMAPSASLRELRPRAQPLASLACGEVAILDDLDSPRDLELLALRLAPP